MTQSKSSSRWLRRHVTDPYVKRARAQGYRSRAAYKLLEIDRTERLLHPGARVVDLGAAPGGWSQVAAQKVTPRGTVIAVDLLEVAPVPGVDVVLGDFREEGIEQQIVAALHGKKADVVLSDVAPNVSGIAASDQARAAELARAVLQFCVRHLERRGALLLKLFQGEEFPALRREMKETFAEVRTVKPPASRTESRETYLLGRGLRASPS